MKTVIAALVAISFCAPAFADPCANQNNVENKGKEAANDPCHEAKIFDFGATMQVTAGVVYTAAATICGVACYWQNTKLPQSQATEAAAATSAASICGAEPFAAAACATANGVHAGTITDLISTQTTLANLTTACTVAGLAAMGTDVAGGVGTGIVAGDVIRGLTSSLASLGGIGMTLAMNGFSAPTTAAEAPPATSNNGPSMAQNARVDQFKQNPQTPDQAKANTTAENRNTNDGSKGKQDNKGDKKKISCPQAYAMHILNAVIRGANAAVSFAQAANARKQKEELIASNKNAKLASQGLQASAGGENGGGGTALGTPDITIQRTPATVGKPTAEKVVSNAAAASEGNARILKDFGDATGHSPEELAQRILDGQPPLQAAADLAGANLGGEPAQHFAEVSERSDEIIAAVADKMPKDNISTGAYEAAVKGRGPASEGDAMPDMGSLLAQLMPQQQMGAKPAGPPGAKGVGFGQKAGPKVDKDGFHPPDRSLFDIVGMRYQIVSRAFLAGENISQPKPASLIPTNPYLRR